MLFTARKSVDLDYLQPDCEKILEKQRQGYLRNELWADYCAEAAKLGKKAYKLSRFNEIVTEYRSKHDISFKMNHVPGLEGQADWTGDHGHFTDCDTGERVDVHVFVMTLPYSGFFYKCASDKILDALMHSVDDSLAIVSLGLNTAVTAEKNAKYESCLIHDFWSAYLKYHNVKHSFCNSHLERELIYAYETTRQSWADALNKLLSEVCGKRNELKKGGASCYPPELLASYLERYDALVAEVLTSNNLQILQFVCG